MQHHKYNRKRSRTNIRDRNRVMMLGSILHLRDTTRNNVSKFIKLQTAAILQMQADSTHVTATEEHTYPGLWAGAWSVAKS